MKKLFFVLFTITAMFAFTACGSDDEKEAVTFTSDCKQTVELKGFKDQVVTIPEVSASLEDLLKVSATGYDGTRISTGELNLGKVTASVTGLRNGVVLKDFKVKINGVEQSFGDITVADIDLYTNKHIDFFKNSFTRMVNQHALKINVTFTPSEDIPASDNLKLELNFNGKYTYWKKI